MPDHVQTLEERKFGLADVVAKDELSPTAA